MKYMTDANIAHVAPKLREKGIDCETVHKRMRNNEDSRARILDGEILAFLRKAEQTITLIASDIDMADHCRFSDIPHITIWDAVAEHILNTKSG